MSPFIVVCAAGGFVVFGVLALATMIADGTISRVATCVLVLVCGVIVCSTGSTTATPAAPGQAYVKPAETMDPLKAREILRGLAEYELSISKTEDQIRHNRYLAPGLADYALQLIADTKSSGAKIEQAIYSGASRIEIEKEMSLMMLYLDRLNTFAKTLSG